MTSIVRIQNKGQVTIPTRLRAEIGLTDGDLVEAKTERGRIILTPKLVDRTAQDDYTPAQRRVIDARLAKALDEVKKGQTFGPFETPEEMIKFLHHAKRRKRVARRGSR